MCASRCGKKKLISTSSALLWNMAGEAFKTSQFAEAVTWLGFCRNLAEAEDADSIAKSLRLEARCLLMLHDNNAALDRAKKSMATKPHAATELLIFRIVS